MRSNMKSTQWNFKSEKWWSWSELIRRDQVSLLSHQFSMIIFGTLLFILKCVDFPQPFLRDHKIYLTCGIALCFLRCFRKYCWGQIDHKWHIYAQVGKNIYLIKYCWNLINWTLHFSYLSSFSTIFNYLCTRAHPWQLLSWLMCSSK